MTFKFILHFMKNLRLLNDRNVDQNRFIIECARKKKAKKSPTVSEFFLGDVEEPLFLINSYVT